MKYAALIYEKPGALAELPDSERERVFSEYFALSTDSRWTHGAQLQPIETATTVEVRNGQTSTIDGPFADTPEVFSGEMVFDVAALDEALEIAARIPAARLGGQVEVRPLVERSN